MNYRRSGRLPSAAVLCCLTILTACAAPSQPAAVRGALIVVGSGTQQNAINTWSREWTADNKAASVNFSPDGQEVGVPALLAGSTYVATSDSPLAEPDAAASTEACGPDGAFSLPTSITPVGVAYNLAGIRGLKLDAPTLTAIFTGTVKAWNDPRIESLNPSADLPEKEIIPVTSEEPTALAHAATNYLSSDQGKSWPAQASRSWPLDVAGTKVKKEGDIAQEVDDHFGTIAFMKMGDIGNRFNTLSLEFNDQFASLSTDPINDAIAGSGVVSGPHGVSVVMGPGHGTGYQLATVNYQVFCSNYRNPIIAALVKSWAEFVVSEPGQTKARIYAGAHSPSDPALKAARSLASTIGSRP